MIAAFDGDDSEAGREIVKAPGGIDKEGTGPASLTGVLLRFALMIFRPLPDPGVEDFVDPVFHAPAIVVGDLKVKSPLLGLNGPIDDGGVAGVD